MFEFLYNARILLTIVSIIFIVFLVRKMLRLWLGGPTREQEYRKLRLENKKYESGPKKESPFCPICGSPTSLFQYPHLKVWRCSKYPKCKGFVKVKTRERPKFARDWQQKHSRISGK